MRTIASFQLLLTLAFLAGCGNGATTIDGMQGVSVKVLHPTNVSLKIDTRPFTDEAGKHGIRYSISGSDSSGVKTGDCVVKIAGSRLKINGRDYGSVTKRDAVVIDGDSVHVNGVKRSEFP